MQEPVRLNLLNNLQNCLKVANRKTYLHFMVYAGDYKLENDPQDKRFYQMLFESNIKLINDDYCDEPLTGFGMFYTNYFINILEGPEDVINKHLKTLFESINENQKVPKISRAKVLLFNHHMNQRNYFNWFGRQVKPPVLLEKIESTKDPTEIRRQLDICLMKLYRLSTYLRSQPVGLFRAAIDNISELCQQHLPEFNLLDFLLNCSSLMDLRYYASLYAHIPPLKLYHDVVWPVPEDFIPYDVIGVDKRKKLVYVPEMVQKPAEAEEAKEEEAKEEEEVEEAEEAAD